MRLLWIFYYVLCSMLEKTWFGIHIFRFLAFCCYFFLRVDPVGHFVLIYCRFILFVVWILYFLYISHMSYLSVLSSYLLFVYRICVSCCLFACVFSEWSYMVLPLYNCYFLYVLYVCTHVKVKIHNQPLHLYDLKFIHIITTLQTHSELNIIVHFYLKTIDLFYYF